MYDSINSNFDWEPTWLDFFITIILIISYFIANRLTWAGRAYIMMEFASQRGLDNPTIPLSRSYEQIKRLVFPCYASLWNIAWKQSIWH